MFTGIVSEIGEVVSIEPDGTVLRLVVACDYRPREHRARRLDRVFRRLPDGHGDRDRRGRADASWGSTPAPETLAVTTAGSWTAGTRLNLERALKVGDELGGHIVSGHVDGIARITGREDLGEAVHFTFAVPPELARFIAPKGSVCLDGTSLTVNVVDGMRFTSMLIPHTLAVTTWAARQPGDSVNLEVDQMARYAARLAEASSLR